jgi:hypothetical protein
LESKGYYIANYPEENEPRGYEELRVVRKSTTQWLEEYFGIDGNKLEKEKLQLLELLRKKNQGQ